MPEYDLEKDGLSIDTYMLDENESVEDGYKGTMTLTVSGGTRQITFGMEFEDAIALWAYVDWLQNQVLELGVK